MFYSETLLSKTGPLARVWLSANLERKLSKSHILTSDIEGSVSAIVDQGQAPLALRLSGQLLLGVVRIYSRKARYLLEDCNEAILKIKMTFRTGNVDLPANQSQSANPSNLVLPDVLTELDLLGPLPDLSLIQSKGDDLLIGRRDKSFLNWPSSQRLSSSMIETGRSAREEPMGLEDDLGLELDIGEDFDPNASRRERDIEVGRDAPAQRSLGDELEDTYMNFDGDDLGLDLGKTGLTPTRDTSLPLGLGNGLDDINFAGIDDDTTLRLPEDPNAPRDPHSLFEPEEESVHQHQRAKRRKVLQADTDTEIHSSQIRAQQNDRSKILKPASFLPRDPMLLTLMEMQKNGGFVSSILGDGRSKGWAPELRGILSLEVVRGSTELKRKRKRDSGIAGVGPNASRDETPAFQFEDVEAPGSGKRSAPAALLDDDVRIEIDDADVQFDEGPAPNFEDTTMPLLHPDEQGPVSLGTKHAVHLLRERFGGASAADSPAKRAKSSVLFEDLLPDRTTTKANATKMFFEVLVLATKDAVKVEQEPGVLGGPLRVRAKRGLWGSWAETKAGGEIDEEEEAELAAAA